MFEYLVVDYTDYDQPGDPTPMHIVTLGDLLKEVQRAIDDRLYCIAIYEIQEQTFLDFSVPRDGE